jgi:hypothetical protein
VGLIVCLAFGCLAGESRLSEYQGMCDASAGYAVDSNRFLAANDEDNSLRLYSLGKPGPPERSFDLSSALEVDRKHPESDLEGCARLGDLVFWIGSHGRSAEGEPRDSRCRLIATRVQVQGQEVKVSLVGRPYRRLIQDLGADPRLARYHLPEAAERAPKEKKALNIEGLCSGPTNSLWIGFRNPVPQGKALLIPLLNPSEVIEGKRGSFGKPVELNLKGLGIRDLAQVEDGYLLIAGSWDGRGKCLLYRWAGGDSVPQRIPSVPLQKMHAEALVVFPGAGEPPVQVLMDDGTRLIDDCECKRLKDPAQRRFRALLLRDDSPEE